MATKQGAPPLTYEDLEHIPDDGNRHELIAGEKHVSPSPRTIHQRTVLRLVRLMADHVDENDLGEVFVAPYDVILSETDVVQPDVVFVEEDRASIVKERGIEGVPSLVVEVVSEGNRRYDEILKRQLYATFDVPEYWVVDPSLATIKVYRHPDGGYDRDAELRAEDGDTISTPLVPEWTLPLSRLFPDE
jgi:Uma2 family endonuclease